MSIIILEKLFSSGIVPSLLFQWDGESVHARHVLHRCAPAIAFFFGRIYAYISEGEGQGYRENIYISLSAKERSHLLPRLVEFILQPLRNKHQVKKAEGE